MCRALARTLWTAVYRVACPSLGSPLPPGPGRRLRLACAGAVFVYFRCSGAHGVCSEVGLATPREPFSTAFPSASVSNAVLLLGLTFGSSQASVSGVRAGFLVPPLPRLGPPTSLSGNATWATSVIRLVTGTSRLSQNLGSRPFPFLTIFGFPQS